MKLNIAGEMKEYPDDMTVQEWMDYTDVPNQEVALIQLNEHDIPIEKRTVIHLKDGDTLQLLYFLGDS